MCNIKSSLGPKDISILWYSGLIRGSVAFALSFSITSKNSEGVKRIILIVTMLSTLILGSFAEKFKKKIQLDIPEMSEDEYSNFDLIKFNS
jgi:hypothetical protein